MEKTNEEKYKDGGTVYEHLTGRDKR